jgi:hypothetical protein
VGRKTTIFSEFRKSPLFKGFLGVELVRIFFTFFGKSSIISFVRLKT